MYVYEAPLVNHNHPINIYIYIYIYNRGATPKKKCVVGVYNRLIKILVVKLLYHCSYVHLLWP